MKTNLENGFLLLYDWLPMLEDLSAEGLRELIFALIDRQRKGASEPQFSDPRSALYFRVIEPTIERRLAGQRGGQKAHEKKGRADGRVGSRVGSSVGTTQPSKAEQSKEKQSIAIAERSSAEPRVRDERIHSSDASCAPRPPLSEEEKETLISFGISESYISNRLSRAVDYANEHGKSVAEAILDWWYQDRQHPARLQVSDRPPKQSSPANGEARFTCNSFDTDDFFQAALNRSFRQ